MNIYIIIIKTIAAGFLFFFSKYSYIFKQWVKWFHMGFSFEPRDILEEGLSLTWRWPCGLKDCNSGAPADLLYTYSIFAQLMLKGIKDFSDKSCLSVNNCWDFLKICSISLYLFHVPCRQWEDVKHVWTTCINIGEWTAVSWVLFAGVGSLWTLSNPLCVYGNTSAADNTRCPPRAHKTQRNSVNPWPSLWGYKNHWRSLILQDPRGLHLVSQKGNNPFDRGRSEGLQGTNGLLCDRKAISVRRYWTSPKWWRAREKKMSVDESTHFVCDTVRVHLTNFKVAVSGRHTGLAQSWGPSPSGMGLKYRVLIPTWLNCLQTSISPSVEALNDEPVEVKRWRKHNCPACSVMRLSLRTYNGRR